MVKPHRAGENHSTSAKEGGIRRIAVLGLYTAAAVLCGYVEYLIPIPLGLPGVKAGLANFVILILLYRYGFSEAMLVSTIRVAIVGMMFGNLFSIFYGETGAILSLLSMTFLKKTGRFGLLGVSAAGGLMHNVGQFLAALLVTPVMALFWYLPVLMIAGEGCGILIALLTHEILRRLPKKQSLPYTGLS